MDEITTIGRCHACKRTFSFKPAEVTTITIDPETGLPPDRTPLGGHREPSPEAVARAVEAPICPNCVDRAKRYFEGPKLDFDTWP
jgi:hypothetical protein